MKYPRQSDELVRLLADDQAQKRSVGYDFFHADNKAEFKDSYRDLKLKTKQRTKRMLQILDEIGEPSISNIGKEGAEAISVLAVHDSADVIRKVLSAFTELYSRDKEDSYYQAIPSLTDCLLVSERKPQRFGTIWLMDVNKEPFLPTIEDIKSVNELRSEYGIESLRWPKSLAIPEIEQPWLKRPILELVMREPTDNEFNDFIDNN